MNRTRTFSKPFGANRSTPFSRFGAANKSRNAAMVDSDDDNNPPMFGQSRFGANRGGFSRSKSPIRPQMGRHVDDDEDEWTLSPIRK